MEVLDGKGAGRYAGTRVARVEDARLLTGHGVFVNDIVLPNMLHACFVRSTIAHALLGPIDTAAAAAVPGVRAVFTAADINPRMKEQWHTSIGPQSPETPRPPLAEGKVRYVGDPVVLILADCRAAAEDAADLVDIDYDPLPAVIDYTTAAATETLVHETHGSNLIGGIPGRPYSDLSPVFDTAAHTIDLRITQQACAPAPMEGRGLIVDYSPSTGEMTIYSATQAPHEVRMFGARLTGLPEHRVRVIARDTGGGFGQKVLVQREEMCVMLAGLLLGVPVKWVEERRENLLAAGQSRHEQGRVRMALAADGEIQAAHIDFLADCGAYPTPWPLGSLIAVGGLFPGPYRIANAGFDVNAVYTNTVGRAAYRGPWQFETLAREMSIDIAARRAGLDAVEVRRRNVLRQDDLPYTNGNGFPYDSISPLETLEQALSILDYEAFRQEQSAARSEGHYLGVGVSTYVEPSTPGYGYYGTEAATIRIEPSGKVNVYIAGGSTGNSLETTVVQMAADALGVDIADVATIQGDTAVTGFGAGTGGSRSGSMTAGAISQTAAVLRERMVAIAAAKLEAEPADIELEGGRAFVAGTPAKSVTVAEIANTAYFETFALPPGVPAGLEASARYAAAGVIWVNATHVCTCEVDPETGRVELLRYIVSEDCGPMINPNVVEGQIAGGVAQGIGNALYENLAYDEDGNPLATTLMDYLVPSAVEIPRIEYGHIETPSPGPGGYKGVGEGGAIGAPPAVVNAVADALSPFGIEITDLPLGPAQITALLQGRTAR